MNDQIVLSMILCVLGLLAHIASKWADYRKESAKVRLMTYLVDVAPARTALSVFSALAALGVLYGMEWLNPAAGALVGWTANSALDNINSKVNQ
jgi:hypothetical protein